MSLYTVSDGNIADAADLNQYYNLITGAMSDQPVTLGNNLTVNGTSLLKGIVTTQDAVKIPASSGGSVAPTSYGTTPVKIAETVLSSNQTNVAFSSIPTVYRHLLLLITTHVTGDSSTFNWVDVAATVNNDSGSRYANDTWDSSSTGTTVGVSHTTSQPNWPWFFMAASHLSGGAGTAEIWFPNYNATDYHYAFSKSFRGDSGSIDRRDRVMVHNANSAGITSIQMAPSLSGQFQSGSVFTLYGLP